MKKKKCKFCGTKFEAHNSGNPGRPQIYCSTKCNKKNWLALNPHTKYNKSKYKSKKKAYYKNKQRALDYKGGCVICGATKNIDYHHLNPKEKEHNVSRLFCGQWKFVKQELDKCIPICNKKHVKLEKILERFVEKLIDKGYNPK